MDKLHQFKELAFGSRIKRLSETLMKDVKQVYKNLYIDFEPTHFATFKTIYEEEIISIGELANYLQISQPAITQFINALQKKELIRVLQDKNDKRKKNIALSKKGHKMAEKLQPVWDVIEVELTKLIDNGNTTFMDHIQKTEQKQKEQPIYNRIMNHLKEQVEIIGYKPEYAPIFRDLNVEWLEKFFYVETHDTEVLENPQSYILDNNGYIFFAKFNNEIVGTVALINEKECYELSKMAVSPKYQGLKIGQQLMDYCIDFSKEQGWNKIMLYSNRKLSPAINLYKKVGFKEIALEKDVYYERADIKMVLNLK